MVTYTASAIVFIIKYNRRTRQSSFKLAKNKNYFFLMQILLSVNFCEAWRNERKQIEMITEL